MQLFQRREPDEDARRQRGQAVGSQIQSVQRREPVEDARRQRCQAVAVQEQVRQPAQPAEVGRLQARETLARDIQLPCDAREMGERQVGAGIDTGNRSHNRVANRLRPVAHIGRLGERRAVRAGEHGQNKREPRGGARDAGTETRRGGERKPSPADGGGRESQAGWALPAGDSQSEPGNEERKNSVCVRCPTARDVAPWRRRSSRNPAGHRAIARPGPVGPDRSDRARRRTGPTAPQGPEHTRSTHRHASKTTPDNGRDRASVLRKVASRHPVPSDLCTVREAAAMKGGCEFM